MRWILNSVILIGWLISQNTMAVQPLVDLQIESASVYWENSNQTVIAYIKNSSFFTANDFVVDFNANESPVSQNHHPQIRYYIKSLTQFFYLLREIPNLHIKYIGSTFRIIIHRAILRAS